MALDTLGGGGGGGGSGWSSGFGFGVVLRLVAFGILADGATSTGGARGTIRLLLLLALVSASTGEWLLER